MLDLKTLQAALGGEISGGRLLCPGPNHSAADRSLSVKLDSSAPDGFMVHSFADDDPIECKDFVRAKAGLPAFKPNGGNGHRRASDDSIERALMAAVQGRNDNKPKGRIVATYDYTDDNGALLYQVLRLEPKSFRQRRPDGNGGYIWSLDGVRRIPYRWPELLKFPDATVFIPEGEGKADRLAALGHCATCVAAGKWTDDCIQALAGRDCIILQDLDAKRGGEPGRTKALTAARTLYGVAKSIRVVLLPGLNAEINDISNWLDVDPRNAETLVDICFDVPPWEPSAAESKTSDGHEDKQEQRRSSAITLSYFSDLKEATPKLWLIKNVIARGETSGWIGPPGAGKSALLGDLCIHGASSACWRGYPIKQQFGALYFALERADLVKRRFIAQRLRDNLSISLPIAVAGQVIDLMDRSCVRDILDAIKRAEDQFSREIGLVAIDTSRRA